MNTIKTKVEWYYFLNIFILSVGTFIFVNIIRYVLRSSLFALLFGLAFGCSRFLFYNVTQIFEGGILESQALVYFLLTVLFIVKAVIPYRQDKKNEFKNILLATLFANAATYTHERYIVLLLVLTIVAVIHPFKKITLKQRILVSIIALGSIISNVAIKTTWLNMPFFMGTGGNTMEFSFTQASSFFTDAVLSILQINSGPEYLIGIQFKALPIVIALLSFIVAAIAIVCFFFISYKTAIYLTRAIACTVIKASALKPPIAGRWVPTIALLSILFFLCILPAVATIRLEQRWLTAPFGILLIMMAIAITNSRLKVSIQRSILLFLPLTLLLVNHTYLSMGATNIYMFSAEKTARTFKEAQEKNIIYPTTKKLYIYSNPRNANRENEIQWAIMGGYLFKFYNANEKQIVFTDSIYTKTDTGWIFSFPSFDPSNSQIVQYIGTDINDITKEYLKDSLKSFNGRNYKAY